MGVLLLLEIVNNLHVNDFLLVASDHQKIFGFLAIPEKSRRYVEKPRYDARKPEDRPRIKEDDIGWMQRWILTTENIASVIPPGRA